jgi:2-deoxy-D-gluconate 3-dehydrogenase
MSNLFSLAGRTALITGGNGGIGRALALGLREAGARVAVTGRDSAKNQAVAAELGAEAVFDLDVRDEAAVQVTLAGVIAHLGRLDILINNAGMARIGTVLDQPLEDWNFVLNTILTGSFLCAKYAAPVMAKQGMGGKIINIGSMYSLYGPPNVTSYAAAKAGILGLTRALAVELAPHNIQVNAILPGWYPTGGTAQIKDAPLGEYVRRKTPAARWGKPEDLVGAAVFLSSTASDFVTGTAIPVDGGYSIADRQVPE